MPDIEFSLEFIERVQAGLVPGWRVQNTAQGDFLVDSTQQQSWKLCPDDPSQRPGHIVATEHPPKR